MFDPETGFERAELEVRGTPVAFGDPFDSGYAHVVTVNHGGVEVWRGPETLPGRVEWSGRRGDLWRSGTLAADGTPLGPT